MTSNLVRLAYAEMEANLDMRCPQPKDPHAYLARAVIAAACEERRRGRYNATPKSPSCEYVRAETTEFLASERLWPWCDLAEIDADAVRWKNGVEVRK